MDIAVNKLSSHKRNRALILLAATALLWSLGGLFIKLVDWNPVAIAGMRSAIAALLMLAVIRKPNMNWSAAKLFGAAAYAATVILFVMANKMTTAANAILLQYTAPIYVALFSTWVLKEKTRISDWITILFVFGGMLLFFMDNLTTDGFAGNILAIASGISFAIMILLLRMQKNESPMESIFWGNIATALIGLPFMFESMPDAESWGGLVILGVVQLGLAYILYAIAIKHVTALEAILIPVIEPILNPVWVFLVVGELPGRWAIVGGLVVLAAITIRCIINTFSSNMVDENL